MKIRNLTLLILMCGLCLTLLLTACGRSDAASSASAEAVSPQTVAESVYHGSEPIAIPETVYENGTAVVPETVENAVYD